MSLTPCCECKCKVANGLQFTYSSDDLSFNCDNHAHVFNALSKVSFHKRTFHLTVYCTLTSHHTPNRQPIWITESITILISRLHLRHAIFSIDANYLARASERERPTRDNMRSKSPRWTSIAVRVDSTSD